MWPNPFLAIISNLSYKFWPSVTSPIFISIKHLPDCEFIVKFCALPCCFDVAVELHKGTYEMCSGQFMVDNLKLEKIN